MIDFEKIQKRAFSSILNRLTNWGISMGESFVESSKFPGSIPVLSCRGDALAEAWEMSILTLVAYGSSLRTQYDRTDEKTKEFIDPPSMDCTMRVVVDNPAKDPMLHRCFPGSLESLEEYRLEVLYGIKDHWIRQGSADHKWQYTYHERMFNYGVPGIRERINQFEQVAQQLSKCFYTRRSQMITWKVWEDNGNYDPACLQSLWFRIREHEGVWYLNLNVRFRSRDAYDAAFMNMFALISLMKAMAYRISAITGNVVKLGRYVDESDSYHIYGHRLEDMNGRFLARVDNSKFEDRTWNFEDFIEVFRGSHPDIILRIKQADQNMNLSTPVWLSEIAFPI